MHTVNRIDVTESASRRKYSSQQVLFQKSHEALRDRMARDRIFICYSRADNDNPDFVDILRKHPDAVNRTQPSGVLYFSDHDIEIGDDWNARIQEALDRARVAVLLEGPGLMTNQFVQTQEIPRLLTAQLQEGVRFFRIPIRHVPADIVPPELSRLQAAQPINKPLAELRRPQREKAISEIVGKLIEQFKLGVGPPGDVFDNPRYKRPFTVVDDAGASQIKLFPLHIRDWVRTQEFSELAVPLTKRVEDYISVHADRVPPLLEPIWRLDLPQIPQSATRLSYLSECAALEQCVARVYPRFRDAQLALYMCLPPRKSLGPELEYVKHAKGVMRSLLRKQGSLSDHVERLYQILRDNDSEIEEIFLPFYRVLQCIPLSELGILQRLELACREMDLSHIYSLHLCYRLLDRVCHWLHMTNRLLNRIPGVDTHSPILDHTPVSNPGAP